MVSSGAVGLGMERMGLTERPSELSRIQACAAIGQSRLMAIYDDAFDKLGCRTAQVLLTEDDFRDPERYSNLRSTLGSLLTMGVIPVINENDTVSTVELDHPPDSAERERVFGDNDKLSALVMTHIDADFLLLLSDVDGLYNGDPSGGAARADFACAGHRRSGAELRARQEWSRARRHGQQIGSRSNCYRSERICSHRQRTATECNRTSLRRRSSRNAVSPTEHRVTTPVREVAEHAKAASRLLGTISSDRRTAAIRDGSDRDRAGPQTASRSQRQRPDGSTRDARGWRDQPFHP